MAMSRNWPTRCCNPWTTTREPERSLIARARRHKPFCVNEVKSVCSEGKGHESDMSFATRKLREQDLVVHFWDMYLLCILVCVSWHFQSIL